MPESVVRFGDLKIGERFMCYEYDPVYENITDLPGGASEFIKVNENTAADPMGLIWRLLYRLNGASWAYEFSPRFMVVRLDIPIVSVDRWFLPEEKVHKYHRREGDSA